MSEIQPLRLYSGSEPLAVTPKGRLILKQEVSPTPLLQCQLMPASLQRFTIPEGETTFVLNLTPTEANYIVYRNSVPALTLEVNLTFPQDYLGFKFLLVQDWEQATGGWLPQTRVIFSDSTTAQWFFKDGSSSSPHASILLGEPAHPQNILTPEPEDRLRRYPSPWTLYKRGYPSLWTLCI